MKKTIEDWRRALLWRDRVEGAVWTAALFCGAIAALVVADDVLLLPYAVRMAAVAALAAGVGWLAWLYGVRPLALWSPKRVIAEADRESPGVSRILLPAWELAHHLPPHVSQELAQAHAGRAEALVEELAPIDFGLWPAERVIQIASGAALALLLAWGWADQPSRWERILTPWRRVPLESLIEVSGNIRVPWGAPAAVTARWRSANEDKLALFVRAADGSFQRQEWDGSTSLTIATLASVWSVPSLSEVLYYQIRWRDQATREFALEPIAYPQFSDVRYKLTPPAHAQLPAEELPGGGDIEALAGTTVEILGRSQDEVEKAVLKVGDGPETAFDRGGDGAFRAVFTAAKSGTFRWELLGPAGIADPHPAEHKLTVLEDRPPSIELLSPTFEIEISPREELPVAFSASDDFGLAWVRLVTRARLGGIDSGPQARPVAGLEPRAKEWVGEYRWDLSSYIPGSTVDFYLIAADTARPPHVSSSAVGSLRIVDFDAAHGDAMDKRTEVEKGLEQLAAHGSELAELMKKAKADTSVESEVRRKEEALNREWIEQLQRQSELGSLQDQDPYLNPAIPAADKAVLDDLKGAAEELLPEANAAAKKKDWDKAAERHSELAKEAARARENMKEIGAYQNVRDMADSTQKMDQVGSSLEQALKEMGEKGKPGEEDWKEVEKQLKEIQKELAEMAKAIEKLAREAPKTMTGQEKVYEVPIMDAMQQSMALQSAMNKRDLASALKAAQDLKKSLAQMRKTLEEASGSMGPPEASRNSKKIEDLLAEWDRVVKSQEDVVGGVRALEDARLKQLMESQKALLVELLRIATRAQARQKDLRIPPPPEIPNGLATAVTEFQAGRVEKTPKLLEDSVAKLRLLAPARPEDAPILEAIRTDEEEILSKLKQGADQSAKGGGAQEAPKQAKVEEQIGGLEKRVSDLRKEAVFLPRETAESLDQAKAEAGAAVKSLEGQDTRAGLEHGLKVLELLQQGKDKAQQSLEQEKKMESVLSVPQPQSGRGVRRAGGAGQGGSHVAPVKLPSAGDYQPPQEIRKQVLDSMQEKMPPGQSPAIKQYLKKVAE